MVSTGTVEQRFGSGLCMVKSKPSSESSEATGEGVSSSTGTKAIVCAIMDKVVLSERETSPIYEGPNRAYKG